MEYVIYSFTNENSQVIPVFIPRFYQRVALPTYDYFTNVSYLTEHYPDFKWEITLFVSSEYNYNVLHNSIGFPNVVDVSSHVGEKWFNSNGCYIYFRSANTILFYKSDNTVLDGLTISSTGAASLPSDIFFDNSYWLQYISYISGQLGGRAAISDYPSAGLNNLLPFWEGSSPSEEDTDPYAPDGNTEPGGGGGTPDPSEDITDPTLPTVSAVDTGFITLFKPSVSNLNSLATYMWSGGFDIDTFKKIMGNPMDAILGLSILPGIVPSGGSGTVVVGNVSTGVSMPKVGNQYVKFNCGSKTIKRKWNAFLDYSPYTRAYIYLPYIGIHPVEVDDIMNKSVTVKYNIDVLSGGCTAFVIAGGTTLYAFTGQCACSVPVTGRDWTTLINGVLGAVTGTVGAIGSAMVGNLPGAIAGAASVAQNVLSSKPTIERSGSMGGMAGMMGIRTPYIIIERPVQAVPGKQNKYIGYPSFVTKKLGDVSGYTQAEITHLEAIPATLTEQEEIKNLLEEGVIL